MQRLATTKKKTVGLKQTQKAVERGLASTVFVARDAEEKVRRPILEACRERGITVIEVDTMAELGKASGIQVGTAVAALLMEVE
ncbi:MAG: ribosomal L7Ae/L30e/S12e/Gadd45 family protein [Peptococcaceae bacterium]|nr:ribosomal L7Ae/L30e/S12e/Gadd45 family protein [Peptococcaceae bacterium]MDH7526420.1 ribosomal L7Ae/L30e/S12e/Gadd45 family protein [Peptococcaceae bacterium]